MAVSGFNIKDSASGAAQAALAEWFGTDLTFPDTPPNVLREIHVQITTSVAVEIEVTFDGIVFVPINNTSTITGLATFTMFVIDTSLFNIRTAAGSVNVDFTAIVTSD